MTLKVLIAGLQSLRASTPGLVFLGVALLLVVLPRQISASAGTGTALAASLAGLLAMVVAPAPSLPDHTDLVKSTLSQFGPVWLAVVLPLVVACLQRSMSMHRGLAVAGVHFAFGSLCFAFAAGTPSLLILCLTLTMIGAATIATAAESDIRTARFAGRSALYSSMMWALFLVGLSLAARVPVSEGVGTVRPGSSDFTRHVGVVFAVVALLGLFGWGPASGWLRTGNIGVRTATTTVYSLIAMIAYLKLFPVLHVEGASTVLWALSMASLFSHLASLRTRRFDEFATSVLGFWTSVAVAFLVTAHGPQDVRVVVGAFALLIFVSIVGPAFGAVVDACTLNLDGDLGSPRDFRRIALKSVLYLFVGLPFSLGFWALKHLAASAITTSEAAGMRQITVAFTALGALAIGFYSLRHLSVLAERPLLPSMDDECRWQAGAAIGGAGITILIGIWPAPFFALLHEIVRTAASVLPDGPLKP